MSLRDFEWKAEPHLALGHGAEFDAIRAMLHEWGPRASGIGDDAAVLDVAAGQRLVVSTDASFEGVHFRREWLSAQEIGARAVTAALSDLAAMAAAPLGLLLALGVPEAWQQELPEVARGVGHAAGEADCPIVGGNVTRARELSLTITVLGATERPLRRDDARVGDVVFVTGRLGGPGAALEALQSGRVPDAGHLARFAGPRARLREARWLAAAGARAAIDISDGLGADLTHLARASGVTIELAVDRVPCIEGVSPDEALTSGEEYEIVVAFPPDAAPDTVAFEALFGIPLTRIGVVRPAAGEPVRAVGARVDHVRGHDHLS
ncbi:MAG TPA: thiamine-phosphate kinase [Gemmatimonadaceae bacterium]|nr:thiamine-phosphate kinase [Gemmatimonadaceae bacterium]